VLGGKEECTKDVEGAQNEEEEHENYTAES
jgi:hypothetical protein